MRSTDLNLESMNDQQVLQAMLSDDELFAELALHISTKNKVIPFLYNQPQRMLAEDCAAQHAANGKVQTLVLKARQMGLSTAIQGRGFKRVITTPNYKMEVVSHDDDSAVHILEMSKLFHDTLPSQLKPMTKFQPKTSLYFANPDKKTAVREPGLRSGIVVTSARNAKAGRSKTCHFLHFSEAAFYDREPDKLVSGYMQAVPEGIPTEVFLETTANGNEGYFYELWRAATKGQVAWKPLFIPWWKMDAYQTTPSGILVYDKEEDRLRERFSLNDHQLAWRRMVLRARCNGDLMLFRQEYPSDWMEAFQSSGSKFFPAAQLQPLYDRYEAEEFKTPLRKGRLERDDKKKPVWMDDPEGPIILHRFPSPDMAYIVTVDSSEGTEDEDHDPSGLLVTTAPADVGMLEQECLEYNGFLDPDQLADLAMLVGEWYNWAYLMHEDNNHGIVLTRIFSEQNYPCCYEREQYDEQTGEITQKLGFRSDQKSKPLILNLLKADLREGRYVPLTTMAIEELLAFKKSKVAHKGGLYSGNAKIGSHDERVIIRALNRLAAQVAPRTPPGKSFDYAKAAQNYTRR